VTAGFIQLPADSTGKKLLTEDLGVAGHVQQIGLWTPPTFYAVFDRIAPAANKYMATLWNGAAGRKVRIHRIVEYNWRFTAVTGVILEQYLAFITARTAGTAVTIRAMDPDDSLTSGIVAATNDTAITEDHIFRRFGATAEEVKIGALTMENLLGLPFPEAGDIYNVYGNLKPRTLKQNQGVAIRNVTSSTVGDLSYVIEFTDEAA
jgi:hypothetical protein